MHDARCRDPAQRQSALDSQFGRPRAVPTATGAGVMLGLPPSVRISFAVVLFDMRNGIDGLRAMVEGALKKDPNEGHLVARFMR